MLVGFGDRGHKASIWDACPAAHVLCGQLAQLQCWKHPSCTALNEHTAQVRWAVRILKMSDLLHTQGMFYTACSWAAAQEGLRLTPKNPRRSFSPDKASGWIKKTAARKSGPMTDYIEWHKAIGRHPEVHWMSIGIMVMSICNSRELWTKAVESISQLRHWKTDTSLGTAPLPAGGVMRNSRKIGN